MKIEIIFLFIILYTNIITITCWVITDNITLVEKEEIMANDEPFDYQFSDINESYINKFTYKTNYNTQKEAFPKNLTNYSNEEVKLRNENMKSQEIQGDLNTTQILRLKELLTNKIRKRKRQLSQDDYKLVEKTDKPIVHYEYDYEKFTADYDENLEQISAHEAKLNITDFRKELQSECNAKNFFNKGVFTIACLISEAINGPTEKIENDARFYLKKILKFWIFLLVVFILIGWSHFGLCNFLCPFSWCFPEDSCEQMKQYLAINGPGIATDIKPKSDKISKTVIKKRYYKPMDREYYLYNNLWQDINHE